MIAIRKDAMRYRDPETGKFVGVSLIGGDAPSDTSGTPVEIDGTLTQSGKAADAKAVGDRLSALNQAIDAKGDPTDNQVSAAVNAYLDANPVSGGISTTAKNLLITILRSGVYTNDQSANITALETALGSGTTKPEEPDVPVEKTYTISNELINCTSSNSATSVKENAAYSATLTANDGYTLTGGTVTVTMGGVNITATAYADGVISIASVTGDVEIFASAIAVQAEAALPTDGLVGYFDMRNLDAGTINTAGSLGTAYGMNATQGSASLYSWGAWISESDAVGTTISRSMMIGGENSTTLLNMGTQYTAIGFTMRGYANCFGHSTNGNGWSVAPKYINSDNSTLTLGKEMISGGVGSTNAGYLACGYRVSGETLDIFRDESLIKTYTGSGYEGFARWYDKCDGFSVAPYNDSGKLVAIALYNRALTSFEIAEVVAFFKTLEVTA